MAGGDFGDRGCIGDGRDEAWGDWPADSASNFGKEDINFPRVIVGIVFPELRSIKNLRSFPNTHTFYYDFDTRTRQVEHLCWGCR